MKIEENKRTKMSVFSIRLKVQYYCVLYFCLFRHFCALVFSVSLYKLVTISFKFWPKILPGTNCGKLAYIISPCTYLWNTYVPPRKYYWCARARK